MLAMPSGHLVPLLLLPLLSLLLLQAASVLSDPDTHVYPPECAPPESAVPNNTTAVYHYNGLLPIERCCPQVLECCHYGGFCALNWMVSTVLPGCDFLLPKVCKDYGCSCCVKCSADKCSKCSETGGNCRKKCRADEQRDYFKKCSHTGCHCCKKCTMMDECREANGTCVTNHYECPPGTHASSGCCGGCYCCKPELQKLLPCERKTGSYCSLTDECAAGYYSCFGECEATQFVGGLQQTLVGYCCAPKVPAPVGGETGRDGMGAFDYYLNKMVGNPLPDDQLLGGEIEYEQLSDLSSQLEPRPDSNSVQGDDEKMVEDEIYDEVVSLEKTGQQYAESASFESNDKGETDDINNIEVDADIQIQNDDQVFSPKFDSLVQEDSDSDAPIALDNTMTLDSPMALDDPVNGDIPVDISDQVFDLSDQDDESNDKVESKKHHGGNHGGNYGKRKPHKG